MKQYTKYDIRYTGKKLMLFAILLAVLFSLAPFFDRFMARTKRFLSRFLLNKKPAIFAGLLESRSSSIEILACQRNISITKADILSSPGPAGNCTPEILVDKRDLELLRAQGKIIIA